MSDGIHMGDTNMFKSNMGETKTRFNNSLKTALTEFAGEVQRYSVTLTPVDTGDLRGSSYTGKPESNNNSGLKVEVGYERDVLPENAYSVYVHERTELHHDVGQSKFLETALQTKEPEFLPYLKMSVKRDMGL